MRSSVAPCEDKGRTPGFGSAMRMQTEFVIVGAARKSLRPTSRAFSNVLGNSIPCFNADALDHQAQKPISVSSRH